MEKTARAETTPSAIQGGDRSPDEGPWRRVRRIPRSAWLLASALTLAVASLFWLLRLQSWRSPGEAGYEHQSDSAGAWWFAPVVIGEGRSLPDIRGRINGIAIQSIGRGSRIWIAAPGGYLAYSDNDGYCWVPYTYDPATGELRAPANSPCPLLLSSGGLVHWPELLPRVYAAGEVSPPAIDVRPRQITFKSVEFSPAQQSAPQAQSQLVVVTNNSGSTVEVSTKGFVGDALGEFQAVSQCPLNGLAPKTSCEVTVVFRQRNTNSKRVQLYVVSGRGSPVPVDVEVIGSGGAPAQMNPPPNVPVPTKPIEKAGLQSPPAESKPSVPNQPKSATPVERFQPPAAAPDLLAIEFAGDSSGRIIGASGTLWTTKDGGRNWALDPQPPGTAVSVGNVPWQLNRAGKGAWANQTAIQPSSSNQPYIDFYAGHQCTTPVISRLGAVIWRAGCLSDNGVEHAVLKRSTDGERTWTALTRGALAASERTAAARGHPWIWLPRWYMAALLLCLMLAAPALLSPLPAPAPPGAAQAAMVEGRFSSDKPLAPGDFDALGLTGIALGLSRFLRNKRTEPPLTIAVNGEWGTGKSSLMNLLRCDLESYGMYPVWFNAWHHQKEEHLLAALLQTIRLEAVPLPWDLLGVPFRIRLLFRRFRHRWPFLVLGAAFAVFLIMLDIHLRQHDKVDLFLWLVRTMLPFLGKQKSDVVSDIPVQGGLIAILMTGAALWRGLTAFGANPAALLASVARGNKLKDLEAQTSFRERFVREFGDFTNALGPSRPLVIFIDDLDRCLPENVREVLEAVNFLVSSGGCFVVLGMDRVQVQRAVGLSFEKVAEEASSNELGIAPSSSTASDAVADLARRKRAEFAQRYLEKLINLEVRVPLAEDDRAQQLLFMPPARPAPPLPKERILQVTVKTLRRAVPAAVAVLLFAGALKLSVVALPWLEQLIQSTGTQPQPPSTIPQKTAGGDAARVAAPEKVASGDSRVKSPVMTVQALAALIADTPGSQPAIQQGKSAWPARWVLSVPFFMAAIFLLLVANVVLTTRPGVQTEDSPAFTSAMDEIWYPLVLAKQNTPRAAKRFINRVRYLAMRQSAYSEPSIWWEQTLFPDRLSVPAAPSVEYIPESILVALAAIEQLEPNWIYNKALFDGLQNSPLQDPETFAGSRELCNSARAKHKSAFNNWDKLGNYRKTFLKIWPRVVVTSNAGPAAAAQAAAG